MNIYCLSPFRRLFALCLFLALAGTLNPGGVLARATLGYIDLDWTTVMGDEFKLEVALGSARNHVLRTRLKKRTYRFPIERPVVVFWRVSPLRGDQWEEFTDWREIDVTDPVVLLRDPLMRSPFNGKSMVLGADRNYVDFYWEEPSLDYNYQLEFKKQGRRRAISFPVSGGFKRLSFERGAAPLGDYLWRVRAKSKKGNWSVSKKYRHLNLRRSWAGELLNEIRPFGAAFLGMGYGLEYIHWGHDYGIGALVQRFSQSADGVEESGFSYAIAGRRLLMAEEFFRVAVVGEFGGIKLGLDDGDRPRTESAPYVALGVEGQYYVGNWAGFIGAGGGKNFLPGTYDTDAGQATLQAAGGFFYARAGLGLFF